MPKFLGQHSFINKNELQDSAYELSDIDDNGVVKYFGHINAVGYWYIIK